MRERIMENNENLQQKVLLLADLLFLYNMFYVEFRVYKLKTKKREKQDCFESGCKKFPFFLLILVE